MSFKSTTTSHKPATAAQISYLRVLIAQRDTTGYKLPERLETLDCGLASAIITSLKLQPYKPSQAHSCKEGYYIHPITGEIFVVVSNKANTGTYAKKLTPKPHGKSASWEYAKGVAKELEACKPLTVAEASKLGKLHGYCMVCGRTLTNPASVEAGIGPVCSGKLAG